MLKESSNSIILSSSRNTFWSKAKIYFFSITFYSDSLQWNYGFKFMSPQIINLTQSSTSWSIDSLRLVSRCSYASSHPMNFLETKVFALLCSLSSLFISLKSSHIFVPVSQFSVFVFSFTSRSLFMSFEI